MVSIELFFIHYQEYAFLSMEKFIILDHLMFIWVFKTKYLSSCFSF